MDSNLLGKILDLGLSGGLLLTIFFLARLFKPSFEKFAEAIDQNTKISIQLHEYLKLRNGSMEKTLKYVTRTVESYDKKLDKAADDLKKLKKTKKSS